MESNRSNTPDGILLSDWESVKELAAEYANAIVLSPNDKSATKLRKRMLRLLNRMSSKYGDRPSILATKADYLSSDRRRAGVLEKAFAMAKQMHDHRNMTWISSSLAELYAEDIPDPSKEMLWIDRLGKALVNCPDETEQAVYERLCSKTGVDHD
ncbi:MAG: hypothetical protein KF778_16150 [Rhodocyclaceae bacterium]|nr:hypothetical protein [Rhodocyclaceae bacterium]